MSTGSPAGWLHRRYHDDPVFRATRSPYLVLDRELRMVAANPAYCAATLRTPQELVGRPLFEVFPDNPGLPDADGVRNLRRSLERVLRTGRRHRMHLQRYDVPAPGGAAGFVPRVWLPVNSPVRDEDEQVIGVLHHVEDVTDIVLGLDGPAAGEPRFALVEMVRELRQSNADLQERFRRRVSIEQAIGILMAQLRCTPQDAFTALHRISQDTNRKLHVVAEAVIGQLLDQVPAAEKRVEEGAGG